MVAYVRYTLHYGKEFQIVTAGAGPVFFLILAGPASVVPVRTNRSRSDGMNMPGIFSSCPYRPPDVHSRDFQSRSRLLSYNQKGPREKGTSGKKVPEGGPGIFFSPLEEIIIEKYRQILNKMGQYDPRARKNEVSLFFDYFRIMVTGCSPCHRAGIGVP